MTDTVPPAYRAARLVILCVAVAAMMALIVWTVAGGLLAEVLDAMVAVRDWAAVQRDRLPLP